MNFDKIRDFICLLKVSGISNASIVDLIKVHKCPKKVIEVINGLRKKSGSKILMPSDKDIQYQIDSLEKLNIKVLCFGDDLYPSLLSNIPSPPILLYVEGNHFILNNKESISIVGSRASCITSNKFAYNISKDLCQKGYNVVSGMAAGVDSWSHLGSCDLNADNEKENTGQTVAVLGHGLDFTYPIKNISLRKKIVESGGAIVSTFDFGCAPINYNFPKRNRIIAGMSLGVIIVEATEKSGSLITARYAEMLDRQVFAVPGFPMDKRYDGNLNLLKLNKASIVTCADDAHFALSEESFYKKNEAAVFKESDFVCENENHDNISKKIFQSLSLSPISLDEICYYLKISPELAISSIIDLEVKSQIERTEDGRFILGLNN